jgi:hypothetical protein
MLPNFEVITMRKSRSDSIAATLRAVEFAQKPAPQSPSHMPMRESDELFWKAIIAGRAREEWTDIDLTLAVHLARVQSDIESEGATLTLEGFVLDGKANPRAAIVDLMVKRETALMRSLRMAGTSTGKSQTIRNGRQLERNFSNMDEFDDLIAR